MKKLWIGVLLIGVLSSFAFSKTMVNSNGQDKISNQDVMAFSNISGSDLGTWSVLSLKQRDLVTQNIVGYMRTNMTTAIAELEGSAIVSKGKSASSIQGSGLYAIIYGGTVYANDIANVSDVIQGIPSKYWKFIMLTSTTTGYIRCGTATGNIATPNLVSFTFVTKDGYNEIVFDASNGQDTQGDKWSDL